MAIRDAAVVTEFAVVDDEWAGLKAATVRVAAGSHQLILKIAASFTAATAEHFASVTGIAKQPVSNATVKTAS